MKKSNLIKVAVVVGATMTLSQCLDTDIGMFPSTWERQTGNTGLDTVTAPADYAAPSADVEAAPSYDPLAL